MKQVKKPALKFVVCIDNKNYAASLELHKIYRVLPDDDAAADGDLRVVDGELAVVVGCECFEFLVAAITITTPATTAAAATAITSRRKRRFRGTPEGCLPGEVPGPLGHPAARRTGGPGTALDAGNAKRLRSALRARR